MPNLQQLLTGSVSSPIITQVININPAVEPLDGPTSVDDVMDRFPAEVYQQGKDTHLYRLLTALAGDAGAGLLKKQAYAARLTYEAEFVNFSVLDTQFASTFRFHRLIDETYVYSPLVDALTPGSFDTIDLADQSYYHRIQEFFTATRFGTNPRGLATVATAGSGIPSDIIENYKYVFDLYSDDPLGLLPQGTTLSTAEFTILPRYFNTDRVYTQPWQWQFTFTPPVLNGAVFPVTITTPASVTKSYLNQPTTQLTPDIERNVVDLLDQLKPVGSLGTVKPAPQRYTVVPIAKHKGSSERIHLNRFVSGRPDVQWPAVDPSSGYFIEAGTENEATSFYASARELPSIYHTPETVRGYSETALADPIYGTSDFYTVVNGVAPVDNYISTHIGSFTQTLQAIFPYLQLVTAAIQFSPDNALAPQNTRIVTEGRAIGN